MNKIKRFIERQCEQYETWIAETKEALAHAPEGSLKIRRQSGHIRYACKTAGGKEKYISSNDEAFIRALAQKGYQQKLLFFLTAAQKAMRRFLKLCPGGSIDDIFYALSPYRRALVTPIIPTREQFIEEWLSRPYTPKGFRPDDGTAYYTQKGLRVRSKSELLIAEILDHPGIPYKYECPLTLNGITIYPDFTILDVNRRSEIYLEHCGMLDNESYAADFVRRINLYEENQIYPGEKLILTFETSGHPLNTRNLQALIRRRFSAA